MAEHRLLYDVIEVIEGSGRAFFVWPLIYRDTDVEATVAYYDGVFLWIVQAHDEDRVGIAYFDYIKEVTLSYKVYMGDPLSEYYELPGRAGAIAAGAVKDAVRLILEETTGEGCRRWGEGSVSELHAVWAKALGETAPRAVKEANAAAGVKNPITGFMSVVPVTAWVNADEAAAKRRVRALARLMEKRGVAMDSVSFHRIRVGKEAAADLFPAMAVVIVAETISGIVIDLVMEASWFYTRGWKSGSPVVEAITDATGLKSRPTIRLWLALQGLMTLAQASVKPAGQGSPEHDAYIALATYQFYKHAADKLARSAYRFDTTVVTPCEAAIHAAAGTLALPWKPAALTRMFTRKWVDS